MTKSIGAVTADCILPSHFQTVKGAKIHYLEAGQGAPMVFLHGIPTSSYLWRNILPAMSTMSRCIAPDLIGLGKSDKPEIAYNIADHIEYMENFLEALDLQEMTLVVHGWGSVVGFEYARRHPERIKAIAFYEAHLGPVVEWQQFSLPVQEQIAFLVHQRGSQVAVLDNNYLVEKLLPRGTLRPLTPTEMQHYREPFPTPKSRMPLWQYLQDLPRGEGEPQAVVELINQYSTWLQTSPIPKLMMYAMPGFFTTIDMVQWSQKHLKNLSIADLGEALHFAQETNPERFCAELQNWYCNLHEDKS